MDGIVTSDCGLAHRLPKPCVVDLQVGGALAPPPRRLAAQEVIIIIIINVALRCSIQTVSTFYALHKVKWRRILKSIGYNERILLANEYDTD